MAKGGLSSPFKIGQLLLSDVLPSLLLTMSGKVISSERTICMLFLSVLIDLQRLMEQVSRNIGEFSKIELASLNCSKILHTLYVFGFFSPWSPKLSYIFALFLSVVHSPSCY